MNEDHRLLITGSRRIRNGGRVKLIDRLDAHLEFAAEHDRRLVLVHGDCHLGGADKEADSWGRSMKLRGYAVEVEPHPAQHHPTQNFGPWPGAGPKRNTYVVGLGADACVALIYACDSIYCRRPSPHGSHGATDCADKAEAAGIPTDRMDLWKTS